MLVYVFIYMFNFWVTSYFNTIIKAFANTLYTRFFQPVKFFIITLYTSKIATNDSADGCVNLKAAS